MLVCPAKFHNGLFSSGSGARRWGTNKTTLTTGDFAFIPANVVHAFQIHNTTKVFGVGTAGFERFFHAMGQKTDLTEPQGVYVPDYPTMRAAGEKYWTQFMPEFQFRD